MGVTGEEKEDQKDIWKNNGPKLPNSMKNINLHASEA